MTNPYSSAPDRAFWRRSVSEVALADFDPVARVSFTVNEHTKIATAGSCFAQHIARHLRSIGIAPLVTEQAHPDVADVGEAYHYGLYSARYGNIYTARQMLQLIERAYGNFRPLEEPWQGKLGECIDPFRPLIPGGFATRREFDRQREQHFSAVRNMFEQLDVLVFTLGLTEAWVSREDGAVFPSCPGTAAGTWNSEKYAFHNFTVSEVVADLTAFIARLREVNSKSKAILTVSPVPLVATATDDHVVTATTYSKSVLRVAAQEVANSIDGVDYFPSYEMITGPQAAGRYFSDNRRDVTEEGVTAVMRVFSKHYAQKGLQITAPAETVVTVNPVEAARRAIDAICDEMYNEQAR